MKKSRADIGILTFHCADNYGALLQACGLRQYLNHLGMKTDLVRYEPVFITCTYWWFPYIRQKTRKATIRLGLQRLCVNLSRGKAVGTRKRRTRRFRRRYLFRPFQTRLLLPVQWRWLPYRYYVVGSDQIWNPELTKGLRKAYFGAFQSRRKEKVIAYAASLGGTSLAPEYGDTFGKLLRHVDAVSVREGDALPYIRQFWAGEAQICVDPVFLPGRKFWEKMAESPGKTGYILVYDTEPNQELYRYAGRLSRERNLPVIALMDGSGRKNPYFFTDYAAGPEEFLGYIRHADYVVTNSFHAVAFSIIFERTFIPFLHSTRGVRVRDLLKLCGLEHRLEHGMDYDPEPVADWDTVRCRIAEQVRHAETFFRKNIPG